MELNIINLIVLVLCAVAVQGCNPGSGHKRGPPGSVPLYGMRPPPGSTGAFGPEGQPPLVRPGCDRSSSTRGVPIPRGPPGAMCEPERDSSGDSPRLQGPRGLPTNAGPTRGLSIERSSVQLQRLLTSGKSPEAKFATLDLDYDNYVTLSEWVSEGGDERDFAMFLDDYDLNNDGKIDCQEAICVAVSLR